MKRGCGVLLHITSLPGKEKTGCFSHECFKFIDFLAESGVKYWQVLSFGPTAYGNSPYSTLSVFAGNPCFIDLSTYFNDDELAEYGLLGDGRVDYTNLSENKTRALKDLFERGYDRGKLQRFINDNKYWVVSYAVYMTIKQANGDCDFLSMPPKYRDPKSPAVKEFIQKNEQQVNFHIFNQMLFFDQWFSVKNYANQKGIQVIGDIPIYPAMDSADVWAYNNQFDFKDGQPAGLAGVPPDYFNTQGQFWGNPLYNFRRMARDKYKWWTERMRHAQKMFDVLRIDHFRAFDTYYNIPFEAKSAKEGRWCKGPGIKFFDALRNSLHSSQIILEDLGEITKSVTALRDATGFPGMRVMQFGFDGHAGNGHLPQNYPQNCTAYIGTHDNDTFIGFLKSSDAVQREIIDKYLHSYGLDAKQTAKLAFEDILSSRAQTVVLSMQDLLFQGSESRMNIPGQALGNWQYRIKDSDLTTELCTYLKMLVERSGR